MRIAFFGSSLLSAYWNGAATYYRGIIRALHDLGFRTTFYEPDAYSRGQHKDLAPPDWASVVIYSPTDTGQVERALEEARSADIVVKASGVGVLDSFLEEAVLKLRRPGMPAIFWDVDAPATLDRVGKDPEDPFRSLIPKYDLILTYGGGEPVISRYKSLGARECIPIYNAVDPSGHYPVDPEERFTADLAFLGNRLPDRERRVEEFLLRAASLLPSRRFLLGGSGWQDKPLPANVAYVGHVYTHEHNVFNCSPLAILNVNRESMAAYGYSPATRIFEAAGSAACIITDSWAGIDQFLEPGSEILVARTGAEVADLLEKLTPQRARRIGQAARRRVLANHTYAHRAVQVAELLGTAARPIFAALGGRSH